MDKKGMGREVSYERKRTNLGMDKNTADFLPDVSDPVFSVRLYSLSDEGHDRNGQQDGIGDISDFLLGRGIFEWETGGEAALGVRACHRRVVFSRIISGVLDIQKLGYRCDERIACSDDRLPGRRYRRKHTQLGAGKAADTGIKYTGK